MMLISANLIRIMLSWGFDMGGGILNQTNKYKNKKAVNLRLAYRHENQSTCPLIINQS